MEKWERNILIISSVIIILLLVYSSLPTKVAVLGYHDFTKEKSNNEMQVAERKFEKEMHYLHKHHYKSLKLKDMDCYMHKKCKINRKSVMITMDDGYKSNLTIAAPILKKYNLNAVVFYVGNNYDGHNPNFMSLKDLETLKKDYPNIEIASHTFALHGDDKKSYEEIDADFKQMKKIIDTKYFAYPFGHFSKLYEKVLKDNGYDLAFTFGPGRNHRKASNNESPYEIKRLNISENMPMWKFKLRLISLY